MGGRAPEKADDPAELRRALAELESAIQEGWASLAFRKDPLLVRGAWLFTGNDEDPRLQNAPKFTAFAGSSSQMTVRATTKLHTFSLVNLSLTLLYAYRSYSFKL